MAIPNRDEVERIADYLDMPCAEPADADIALVFGSRLQLLYIAADLLRRGTVRYIGLTTRRAEGCSGNPQVLVELLTRLGVPAERVIVLDYPGSDVLESVVFALPRIVTRIPLSRLKSVVVICEWYVARRVLMTLKRIFPRHIRYYLRSCEPEDLGRPNWYLSEQGAQRVMAECEGIAQAVRRWYAVEVEQQDDQAFA
jgi:hypothetical protein